MKIETAMNGDYVELLLSGTIGTYPDEISLNAVDHALNENASAGRVRVYLNSGGGDAFEGVAISNRFRRDGRWFEVVVDGLAASAASIIAMAGDYVIMPTGSFMMMHSCWALVAGNSGQHKHTANVLGKLDSEIARIYADRTGLSISKVQALMKAETWLNGNEAMALGFADSVSSYAAAKAANVSRFNYKNVPATLYSSPATVAPRPANWADVETERFLDTPPRRKGMSKAAHRALTRNTDTQRELGLAPSLALQRHRIMRKNSELRRELQLDRG